jgi:uncharacterized protein (TIGR03435 family)
MKTNRLKKVIIAAAGILAIVGRIAADSLILPAPRQPHLVFEVASVKPVDRALMTRNHEGNRLDREVFIDRTELYAYIVQAYIRGSSCAMKIGMGEVCPLVTGAFPSWVRTDRFEIEAKLPADSVPNYSDRQRRNNDRPELSLMLQALLQDRFHLTTHHEKREIPVYILTVGKNGPRLKQSPAGSDRLKVGDGRVVEFHGLAGTQSILGPDGTPRMRMTFQASSIQEAIDALSWMIDKPVLDRTGFKGEYDFTLEVDVDRSLPQRDHVDPSSGRGGTYFNPFSGVSSAALSAALQDVGLKLESTKAPLEILVIDHVERPTEN